MAQQQIDKFKKIISHAKEYGFIFPSSEIYDGLSAVYDYGQNGVLLKNNIRDYWWKSMVQLHDENQIFHDTYIENEQKRKHADARTTRLAQALDESQRGIEFWNNCIENGFDELMVDAERVREGGKSSRALARERRQQLEKGGEEE